MPATGPNVTPATPAPPDHIVPIPTPPVVAPDAPPTPVYTPTPWGPPPATGPK